MSLKVLSKPGVAVFVLLLAGAAAQSARASTGPKWSDAELADFSAAIVTGRVSAVASGWDQSVNGIYTYVTVEVLEVLKGDLQQAQIVLKQAGGVVGDLGVAVAGQARFRVGEEVLLFTEVRPRDGTLYTTTLWQGKWTIQHDAATGRRVALRRDPDSQNGEVDRRDLGAFESAIASRAGLSARRESFVAVPSETPVSSGADPYVLLDTPARWFTQPVAVDGQAGGQPGLPGGGFTQLANLLGQWSGAGASFTYSARSVTVASRCSNVYGASGIVTITWNDPCAEISNTGGTIAVATTWFSGTPGGTVNGVSFRTILEVVVTTNDSFTAQQFVLNPNCFLQVLLHELGHALGLGHSADATAVMFATVSFAQCSTSPRNLQPDDIAGVQFIYPGTGGPSPPGGAPGQPINVVALVTNSQFLDVTWTIGAGPTPTSHRLDFFQYGRQVASMPSGPGNRVNIVIPPGAYGAFQVTVIAFAGTAASPRSVPADFSILNLPGPCVRPLAPLGVRGQVVNGIAYVSWSYVPGARSYVVQVGSSPGLSDIFNGDVGNTLSVSAPVRAGFRAWARVITVDNCGVSNPSAEVPLGIVLGSGALQVTLTWDTATDLDLHVIEPDGTHVYYANRQGPTARLDRDVTTGFGPENIHVDSGRGVPGTYQVFMVHYGGNLVTNATIQIRVNVGLLNERVLRVQRQTLGGNPRLGVNVANVDILNNDIMEVGGTRPADERALTADKQLQGSK